MADIASIFVSPIVEKLIDLVATLIKQKYDAITGVKDDLKKLSKTLEWIRDVLEDAEDRQLDSTYNRSWRRWLSELKDAALDAEDILETFAAEARPGKAFQPYKAKKHAASEIKEISERLDSIHKNKSAYSLPPMNDDAGRSRSQTQNHFRSANLPSNNTEVLGRDSEKKELIDKMLSDESDSGEGIVSVIPIVGMGGLGKTTLARLIYNDERVKEHLKLRMWASGTIDFDLERILKEMMRSHTQSNGFENLPLETLASRCLEIIRGKNFLLVLDDVWDKNYVIGWEPLLNILKQGGKGSRVLVTSRNTQVANIMGVKSPHHLALAELPEQESWSLFQKIAFQGDKPPSTELEGIGREIVHKCKGLPLAVKAMAGLLRCNDNVEKWERISRDSIWKLEDDGSLENPQIILAVLKLSYDDLLPCLKQCFSHCSIFPKAYVFCRKELVKLWVVQGFSPARGRTSAEENGRLYFDELVARSFFQIIDSGDEERYRMHDLIHELAVSVSSPQCCHVKDIESVFTEKTRHVSFLCRDLECPNCKKVFQTCDKVRTVQQPTNDSRSIGGKYLDKLFHSLKYIRVLDLSSTSLTELPSSVEKLVLLRSLDLSYTEIKELPNSVCNLWNLQRLKLLGCLWLFELPKDMGKLVNLIYLELDDMFWAKCKKLPPSMGSLTRLQNLHVFRVLRGEAGYGIDELKVMENLKGELHISNLENAVKRGGGNKYNVNNAAEANLKQKESLQKLVLEWSDADFNQEDEVREERNLNDLQPHSNLEELALHHYKGSNFPSWMTDGFLHKLRKLTLSHCSKTTTISVAQLRCLVELFIKGMLELEEWQDDVCPSLRRLHISNCPKLRKVPDFMPCLRVLKIKRCDSLKALPLAPYIMFLTLADNPVLEDWRDNLEDWRDNPVLEDWRQSLFICVVKDDQANRVGTWIFFFHLLELKLDNCPNIQALPWISPQKLEIRGCPLVTALPVSEFSKRLQCLALSMCSNDTLVRKIPSTSSLYSLVISNISNLTSFPKLPHLPGLKSLYISDCEDLSSLAEEEGSLKCSSTLKLLSIRGCPKLESLPDEGLPTALECLVIDSCLNLESLGSKQTLKNLVSLEDLYVENCPLIRSFPEDGLPSSLKHLEIHGCHQLIQQCQENGAEWPKISHITDLEIGSV